MVAFAFHKGRLSPTSWRSQPSSTDRRRRSCDRMWHRSGSWCHCSSKSLASGETTTSCQHCATHFTGCPCLSALGSKLRWWHTIVFFYDICSPTVSVLFRSRLRWHDCTTYVLGPRVTVRALQFPRRGTPDLEHAATSQFANSSSRA